MYMHVMQNNSVLYIDGELSNEWPSLNIDRRVEILEPVDINSIIFVHLRTSLKSQNKAVFDLGHCTYTVCLSKFDSLSAISNCRT